MSPSACTKIFSIASLTDISLDELLIEIFFFFLSRLTEHSYYFNRKHITFINGSGPLLGKVPNDMYLHRRPGSGCATTKPNSDYLIIRLGQEHCSLSLIADHVLSFLSALHAVISSPVVRTSCKSFFYIKTRLLRKTTSSHCCR